VQTLEKVSLFLLRTEIIEKEKGKSSSLRKQQNSALIRVEGFFSLAFLAFNLTLTF
jgi:hypothetical protein